MEQASQLDPTFMQVFSALERHGPAWVTSSRGTQYEVRAVVEGSGRPTIIGRLKRGQVRIHEDCWGNATTCRGSRAGGLLNGHPSIYDWYLTHRIHSSG